MDEPQPERVPAAGRHQRRRAVLVRRPPRAGGHGVRPAARAAPRGAGCRVGAPALTAVLALGLRRAPTEGPHRHSNRHAHRHGSGHVARCEAAGLGARPPGSPTPAASAPGATGDVHSYPVEGGRVVLDLSATSATLVSATPEAGWETKVWNQSESAWIRVDFTSGGTTSSLFCTWNGHPPTVETYTAGSQ